MSDEKRDYSLGYKHGRESLAREMAAVAPPRASVEAAIEKYGACQWKDGNDYLADESPDTIAARAALLALYVPPPSATEGEADARRLDWLEAESAKRGILLDWEDDERVQRRLYEPAEYDAPPEDRLALEGTWRVITNTMTPDGTGLREAIDAAMHAPTEAT